MGFAVNHINSRLFRQLTGEPSLGRRILSSVPYIGSRLAEEERRAYHQHWTDDSGLLTSDALTEIIDAEIAHIEEGTITEPLHLVTLHYDGSPTQHRLTDLLRTHLSVHNSRPIADYVAKLDDNTFGIVMHAGEERVREVMGLFINQTATPNSGLLLAGIAEYIPGETRNAAHLLEESRASYQDILKKIPKRWREVAKRGGNHYE